MTDDPARLNLLTYLPRARRDDPERAAETPVPAPLDPQDEAWQALWLVLATHITGLRRSDVLEDSALIPIARALDAANEARPVDSRTLPELARMLDERLESRVPGHLSGAATLGLAREEWVATASRMLLRDVSLRILSHMLDVTEQTLVLADAHSLTVMPAFLGGRPAQPTTLAHYLGGLLCPLQSASQRITDAFAYLNRSPLGSGILAGDVIGAEREELARRLGFLSPIANTMDALMGVEDIVRMTEATISGIAPIRRFVSDMLDWIRTDPTSFVLDDGWFTSPEPAHPTLISSGRLEVLGTRLTHREDDLHGFVRRLRAVPYGPLGSATGILHDLLGGYYHDVVPVLVESRTFIRDGLIVNRAYLGNRAGRGYTTAGDLAAFLMTEEQLSPASARSISVLVLNQLQKSGLEVSGITQDMIDTAGLMIIGREIKVEMESLGRFLAPRRFLERRQVTGSPAPEMTRAWLADERATLERHRDWVRRTTETITIRLTTLAESIAEMAADVDD